MIPFFHAKRKGVKCILQGPGNELLADGTAYHTDKDSLEIESRKGLPILTLGSRVKLVLHEPGGVQVWQGRVYTSTGDVLRVSEAQVCSTSEKRKTYRVNVNSDARLTAYQRQGSSLHKVWEEMVKLRDISSGGCLIQTRKEFNLAPNDTSLKYTLRITLYSSVEEVMVLVKSKFKRSEDSNLYGLEFSELGQRVEQAIDQYVLKLQQDEIRRSRNVLQ